MSRIFGVSLKHYSDVIMGTIASQITSLTIVYSTIYSDADQRKHQSSASLAFVRGIHRGPGTGNFNYCVVVWVFVEKEIIAKLKRNPGIIYRDFDTTYEASCQQPKPQSCKNTPPCYSVANI